MSIKLPDFSNTENAFAVKSDDELKKMKVLFGLMNKPTLVKLGTQFGLFAIKNKLPFARKVLRSTLFELFCGGTTLLESEQVIDKMASKGVLTVLDYGAEGKQSEEDFNYTMTQMIRSIEFAALNDAIPIVSMKITGLARFELLEKLHRNEVLTKEENDEYNHVVKRVDSICYNAHQHQIAIFIDAEETWIQGPVDQLANKMMARYNQERVIVYNTFQMYRTSSLGYLKKSHEMALTDSYLLGAKLVRGAYMEKERERAAEMGYTSPIHNTKEETDKAFDQAVEYCVSHIANIACCCATHNANSAMLYTKLLQVNNIPFNHHHVLTSQLYGMSDHLTYNFSAVGIHASKYLPYGPVEDVMPYLMRRAQENTSVTGDMSREYQSIVQEIKRRKQS